jgi:hypothetical protein
MANPFSSNEHQERAVRFNRTAVLVSVYVLSHVARYIRRSDVPRRVQNRRRVIRRFAALTRTLHDIEFSRAFWTTRTSFQHMIQALGSLLQRDYLQDIRSSGGYIEPSIRLAVTIRMLAGASYLDVTLAFHIAKSTV